MSDKLVEIQQEAATLANEQAGGSFDESGKRFLGTDKGAETLGTYEAAVNASVEPVTGLLPRLIWDAEMRQHLTFARRASDDVALALMDLDDFKQVNDTQGHPAGDRVLRKVGDSIKEIFRVSDIKGRFGGDEFIVMLTGYSPSDKEHNISNTEQGLSHKLGEKSGVGVTVGMAIWNEDQSLDDLIAAADKRLYKNKIRRKNE